MKMNDRLVEPEIRLVPLLCKTDSISADVGAGQGDYTKIMGQYSKFVHAFEPVTKFSDELARKRFVRGKNVQVHQLALSDHHGTKIMRIPYFKNRFHGPLASYYVSSFEVASNRYFALHCPTYVRTEEMRVQTKTLDSFSLESLAFLKIDVEGHELSVLRGAEKTIQDHLPNMLIEIEERHNPGGHKEVFSWLIGQGYSGYFINEGRIVSIDKFDLELMQKIPLENIGHRFTGDIPGYVNNFIFLHNSKGKKILPMLNSVVRIRRG